MENRKISEEYTTIAHALINSDPRLAYIADSSVDIAFLASDTEKKTGKKLVYGQCEKVPDKYAWAIPFDFTITIYEPTVERFTPEQLRILLLHELLHIGIELDGFEEKYHIVPHDVEEFRAIIDSYGLDWSAEDDPVGKIKKAGRRSGRSDEKSK